MRIKGTDEKRLSFYINRGNNSVNLTMPYDEQKKNNAIKMMANLYATMI